MADNLFRAATLRILICIVIVTAINIISIVIPIILKSSYKAIEQINRVAASMRTYTRMSDLAGYVPSRCKIVSRAPLTAAAQRCRGKL